MFGSYPLNWSTTRINTLDYCERQYYLRYYTRCIAEIDFDIYLQTLLVNNLKTIPIWIGEIVHSEISRLLFEISESRIDKISSYLDERLIKINQKMRFDFERSKFKDYCHYDKKNKFGLVEHMEGLAKDDVFDESFKSVKKDLEAFTQFKYLETIKDALTNNNKAYIENPYREDWDKKKYHHYPISEIALFISPDFWIEYEKNRYMLMDWKTGEKPTSEYINYSQLEGYAFRMFNELKMVQGRDLIEGYFLFLPSGEIEGGIIKIEDTLDFQEKIKNDIERFKDFLVGRGVMTNIPLNIEKFKVTDEKKRCGRCKYGQICKEITN
jgi:hypothetical protein